MYLALDSQGPGTRECSRPRKDLGLAKKGWELGAAWEGGRRGALP